MVVAAGCGGRGDSAGPETATTVAPPAVPVSIDEPKADAVVPATRRRDARLAVSLAMSGRAAAGETIDVRASCPAPACGGVVFSDATGRWTARLEFLLPAGSRRLSVAAAYPTSTPAGRGARVDLGVRASATERPRPTRRSTTTRAPTTSSSTPSTAPRDNPAPSPPTAQPSVPSPAPGTTTETGSGAPHTRVVLIGDSLAVGVQPVLPSLLPSWDVVVDGRVGRPLAEGMKILRDTELPADGSTVLAVSLFTNDDPTHTAELRAAVRTTLERVGPRGCAVWATIARPPLNGVTYDAANTLLRRIAATDSRLRLVHWAETAAAQPSLLGPDGVHPTPSGYDLRARLYARAAESC